MKTHCLLSTLMWAAFCCCVLSDRAKAQSDINFEEVTAINALSQNSLDCIYQDSRGFLWLGTHDGLNKFDGYKFREYRFNEGPRIRARNNRVISIREDRHNKLWIATFDGSIHRFDLETETSLRFPRPEDNVSLSKITSFYESPDGDVWLTTNQTGAYWVSTDATTKKVSIRHIPAQPSAKEGLSSNWCSFAITDGAGRCWIGAKNGLNRIDNSRQYSLKPEIKTFFNSDRDTSDNTAFTKAASTKNFLWFGTEGRGLICFDTRLNTFKSLQNIRGYEHLKTATISALKIINKDLWIGTSNGQLSYYSLSENKFYSFQNPFSENEAIAALKQDAYKQIWIITFSNRILRFDPEKKRFTSYNLTATAVPKKLEKDVFFQDRNLNLWIPSLDKGLALYHRETDSFRYYNNNPQDPSSISSSTVNCIYQDREGTLWVGTGWYGKGLSKIVRRDPALTYLRPVARPARKVENFIRAVLRDSKGFLWAAAKSGRIYLYNKDNTLIRTINEIKYNVYCLYEDRRGFIWLGTKEGGLYRSSQSIKNTSSQHQNLLFKHIKTNNEAFSTNNIYDITEDKTGNLWAASYNGGLNLLVQQPSGKYYCKTLTHEKHGLSGNNVRSLYLDHKNRLWIGTTNGINYLDLNRLNLHRPDFKVPVNLSPDQNSTMYSDVFMISADRNQNIWLATQGRGAIKLTENAKDQFSIQAVNRASTMCYSIMEDRFGYLWMGGDDGLSRYNPVNGRVQVFDKSNGLKELIFSEKTCSKGSGNELYFGSLDGLYIIHPENVETLRFNRPVCFTSFELFNKEVLPLKEGSPLKRTLAQTKEVVLRYDQSSFSIGFSALNFASTANTQYIYRLRGFDKGWNHAGHEPKATYTNLSPGRYIFEVKVINSDRVWNQTTNQLIVKILPPFWKTLWAYVIYTFLLCLALVGIIWIIRLRNNLLVERRVAEAKMKFFTTISHELRTPLTLIAGPVENILDKGTLPQETSDQLRLVHNNTRRLYRLVNQILDLRKAQKDKIELSLSEFDLVALTRNLFESFEELARQNRIKFEFIAELDELFVEADHEKLEISIMNLLSNAFKFTPEEGEISVKLGLSSCKSKIELVVSDTGTGIEESEIPYIFNLFFVSHSETREHNQGTGIGLSIVKEYLRLHKGEVSIDSTPGKGSKFKLLLPLALAMKTGKPGSCRAEWSRITCPESVEPDFPEMQNEDDKPHILIIEDDFDMARYLRLLLSPQYKLSYAKNGLEGWNSARKLTPDLVITDLRMPKMDGLVLSRKLKEEFTTCHIPLIMLTAKGDHESQLRGLHTGADLYLSKPFNHHILLSYVENFLKLGQRISWKYESTVELKPDEIQVAPKDKVFIEDLLKYINENLADADFRVEKLVANFNISRTVFYKKVKGITGFQPVELIKSLRLKRAVELLEKEEMNISEIAYSVGFQDVRYFSTCFKKTYGKSPSHYMKEKYETI